MSGKISQVSIDGIIKEETRKVSERLGFFNQLSPICRAKGLTSEEFGDVYEGLWRNIMKICDSRLKNTIAVKKRYEEETEKKEIEKIRIRQNIERCFIERTENTIFEKISYCVKNGFTEDEARYAMIQIVKNLSDNLLLLRDPPLPNSHTCLKKFYDHRPSAI